MTSTYRFRRVKNGVCHFAAIELDIRMGGDEIAIVDALSPTVNRDDGEVTGATHPSWVKAALDGIKDAVESAEQLGALTTGCSVELRRLVGTDVDTREDAIRCAAAEAVAKGLDIPNFEVVANYIGNAWQPAFSYGSVLAETRPFKPLRWTYRASFERRSGEHLAESPSGSEQG